MKACNVPGKSYFTGNSLFNVATLILIERRLELALYLSLAFYTFKAWTTYRNRNDTVSVHLRAGMSEERHTALTYMRVKTYLYTFNGYQKYRSGNIKEEKYIYSIGNLWDRTQDIKKHQLLSISPPSPHFIGSYNHVL